MTLQYAILKTLDRAHPNGMPETSIIADVNLLLPEIVTPSMVRRELEGMDGVFVKSVKDDDRGLIYFLTPRGQARLQK
jgi:hypothetical protein